MSGTYQLDGTLFPKNPLTKRWSRQQIAVSGVGESIYTDFHQIEMSFGILEHDNEISFFEDAWLGGGLHTVVLPHPKTAVLTGFTGVNIQDFTWTFNDVASDSFTEQGSTLTLNHISLSATGTV